MSSISFIATLSFIVALIPALGFPRSWEEITLVVIGALSFLIALSLRKKNMSTTAPVDTQSAFVENASVGNRETL
jgi:TRAP-type C4-dicarboxylate transport system permease small subunit